MHNDWHTLLILHTAKLIDIVRWTIQILKNNGHSYLLLWMTQLRDLIKARFLKEESHYTLFWPTLLEFATYYTSMKDDITKQNSAATEEILSTTSDPKLRLIV